MSTENNAVLLASLATSLQDLHEKFDKEFATVHIFLAESLRNTAELKLQLANVQRKLDERRTPVDDEKKVDDSSSTGSTGLSETSKKSTLRLEEVRLDAMTPTSVASRERTQGTIIQGMSSHSMDMMHEKQDEQMGPSKFSDMEAMKERPHVGVMMAETKEPHVSSGMKESQEESMKSGKEVNSMTMMNSTTMMNSMTMMDEVHTNKMMDSSSHPPAMQDVPTTKDHDVRTITQVTQDDISTNSGARLSSMSMMTEQRGETMMMSGKRSPAMTMQNDSEPHIEIAGFQNRMSVSDAAQSEHERPSSFISSDSTLTGGAPASLPEAAESQSDELSNDKARLWGGPGGLLERGASDGDNPPTTNLQPQMTVSLSLGDSESTTSSQRRKRQSLLMTVLEEIPQSRDDLSASIQEGRENIAGKSGGHPAARENSLKSMQPMPPPRAPLPPRHEFFGDPQAPLKEFSVDKQITAIPLTEQLTEHSAFPPSVSDSTKMPPRDLVEKKAPPKKRTFMVKDTRVTTIHNEIGIYVGELDYITRQPHGRGNMKYEDGTIYDGEWDNGMWHGKGLAKFPEGDTYQGDFHNDERHGVGKYSYRDGRTYEGDYERSKRSGEGVFTWPDGSVYEGSFLDGYRHGQGTYKFAGDAGQYAGEWQHGSYHGYGILFRSDGRRYNGEFQNGLAHGTGTEMLPDGSVSHDGLWIEDQPVVEPKNLKQG